MLQGTLVPNRREYDFAGESSENEKEIKKEMSKRYSRA